MFDMKKTSMSYTTMCISLLVLLLIAYSDSIRQHALTMSLLYREYEPNRVWIIHVLVKHIVKLETAGD